MIKALRTVGRYFMLMGRTFSRPERMRMFFRQYLNELEQLGVNSIGIVLLISFFILLYVFFGYQIVQVRWFCKVLIQSYLFGFKIRIE